ncbi:hypothetical protein WBK31_16730 [Nonomuraea sp. N2-4H]|uniref:hypothetical protein n=1 Tax=Nonomuraea sp. N2-4H TaxID=3128898 RepID=UPI003243BE24
MLILPSPGTLPVIESAGHSGDVGIKPAPAAAITSDSDESSITKCGWSTNAGSKIALGLRRLLLIRHPQEWLHRRMQADVPAIETLEERCPFPITACGGATDGVAPNVDATYPFRNRETVPGDHKSIIRPRGPSDESYQLFKRLIRQYLASDGGRSAPLGAPAPPAPSPPSTVSLRCRSNRRGRSGR